MKNKSNSNTLLLTLSAAFEYYDFIIYGLMATYLGPLFFPNDDAMVSKLQAFALFALSYIIRPIGGMIWGILADLGNRKKIFILSNLCLAFATIAISFLPSYSQVGITATILLIISRIIQSFSFSAEIPGAITLLSQSSKYPARSFGFVVSGASLGAIFASVILYLIEFKYSNEEILSFAWRIPFIFGAVLCILSLIMRSALQNAPQNKHIDKSNWLRSVIKEHRKIIAFILVMAIPALMIVMNIFFPSFLPKFYNYPSKIIYLATTISLIWSVFFTPIWARIIDRFDKITMLQVTIVATIILSLVINFLLLRGKIIIALCIYQSLISSFMVIILPQMAKSFNQASRFTLIAICYNVTYALVSFLPNIATNLAIHWNTPFAFWTILIAVCIFSLANMSGLYEQDDD